MGGQTEFFDRFKFYDATKVPRITTKHEKDMEVFQDQAKYYGQGKRCAPGGTMALPGTMGRSHSDGIMCGPKSWMQDHQRQKELERATRGEKLKKEAVGNASLCPRVPSFAEPQFPPPDYGFYSHITEKPMNEITAGGKTQGMQTASYGTNNGDGYDPSKHGWAHPEARRKQEELRGNLGHPSQCTVAEPSFRWNIEKARDHIGYNGSMARGNIQSSANAINVPDWFVGVRMIQGPYGPKFPAVDCEDGKMLYNTRVWEKGPNLSIIEKRTRPYSAPTGNRPKKENIPGNGNRPGTAPSKGRDNKAKGSKENSRPNSAPTPRPKRVAPEKPEFFDHWRANYERRVQNDIRCKHGSTTCDMHPCRPHYGWNTKSNLMGTGCVTKRLGAPESNYVGIDPKVPGASGW